MKAPQIFALALRLTGLIFLYHALSAFPGGLFKILDRLVTLSLWALIQTIVGIIWPFILAWWFLRGAPLVMRLTYPNEPRDN
ncbi:MAG: hypothetical protein WAW39_07545 [Prosthecobacter sp.]|uniref:hypothetical protein n=1 Tax=Prosthecobacter sp. TaxID=1965333 RepID=UPI003BAEBFB8